MNIAVKLEGGLGDCLLATRFVPAIKEYHNVTECYITCCYENNRNEAYQLDILPQLYPSFYNSYVLLNYRIDGINLPLVKSQDLHQYDQFYNLKIDDMEWTTYDFNWLSKFYYFPKPETNWTSKDYICLHLTHDRWPPKNLDRSYITQIVKELLQIYPNIKAITTPKESVSYNDVSSMIDVCQGSMMDTCRIVGESKAFLTIDSGFKYIAYACGVPTIEIADHFSSPGTIHPMINARWLPFPSRGLPLYTDPKIISICMNNILKNKIAVLYPYQNSNKHTFKLPNK